MTEEALTLRSVEHRDGRLRARLGPEAAVPNDRFAILEIVGSQIGVIRSAHGYHAIRNWCPHRGAPVCSGWITGTMLPSAPSALDWGMDGVVLRCPWHRWEFDLRTGRTLFDIDRRRLVTYSVRRAGDELEIELGTTEEKYLNQEATHEIQR